jgi:hypothetical protein
MGCLKNYISIKTIKCKGLEINVKWNNCRKDEKKMWRNASAGILDRIRGAYPQDLSKTCGNYESR